MHLYLVQHGDALSKDEDPSRPLSDKGRQNVGRMAAFLARTRPAISRVVHSGKVRAMQTALVFAETLGPGRMVEEAIEGLAPEDSPTLVADVVNDWTEDTMLVGHLPHLARLAGLLLTGDTDETVVHFQPGTVVCLERGENGDDWIVTWAVRPELLGG
jgi:phosphohistidine phosphatase